MLNTYIKDIYCNTYLHPENALRVPNLMEKLIGDTTGEIIDIWFPKLKASVYKIEDEDYGYIFRRSVNEILLGAFGDEYATIMSSCTKYQAALKTWRSVY